MPLKNNGKISSYFVQPKKLFYIINLILLFVLAALIAANQFLIIKTNKALGIKSIVLDKIDRIVRTDFFSVKDIELKGSITEDVVKIVVSQGVPAIYGEELGISFAQVQEAINAMKLYDPAYGKEKIILEGDNKQRYINVGLKISCEYCCGAKSIIKQDGRAACGCAHSQAMRGLLAYLIQNHGSEYTDDELLRELARWKGVYFPKQMIKKLTQQIKGAEFTPDTAALILDLKLPDYGEGEKEAPLPSEIENLPSMVGGC